MFRPPLTKRTLAFGVWLLVTGVGLSALALYSNRPGPVVDGPTTWPTDSRLCPSENRDTMLVFVHPRCPCTRATFGELQRLISGSRRQFDLQVIIYEPRDANDEWRKSDLVATARQIADSKVMFDPGGTEAKRFGAHTSGVVFLYDGEQRLVFSGGITPSRGHHGDSPGRAAILSYFATRRTTDTPAPVFGCPIYQDTPAQSTDIP